MVKTQIKDISNLLSELFTIIGGFILAEMVITQFFSLTNQLPIWILLIFSIALISLGLEFKEHQEDFNKNLLPTLCLISQIRRKKCCGPEIAASRKSPP